MALQLPVTYYVIYYDNMGIEPYDSGYLYEMQLFKTVKDAQDKIDELENQLLIKEEEMSKLKTYINNFEQELK